MISKSFRRGPSSQEKNIVPKLRGLLSNFADGCSSNVPGCHLGQAGAMQAGLDYIGNVVLAGGLKEALPVSGLCQRLCVDAEWVYAISSQLGAKG